MKLKKLFIYTLLLILPAITFAAEENKYTLEAEKVTTAPNSYTYSSDEYQKIIGTTEDNIFIRGRYSIYKLDKEFNVVTSSSNIGTSNILMLNNNIVHLESEYNSGTYKYYFEKYDLNLTEISKVELNFNTTDYLYFYSFVNYNDNYYAFYRSGSYGNYKYNIAVIDETGKVKSNKEIVSSNSSESYNSLHVINDGVYLLSTSYVSSTYTSYLYKVSDTATISLAKTIDKMYVSNIAQDQDGIITLGNDYSTGTASRAVKIYTSSWVESKSISLAEAIEGESSIRTNIGITDNNYMFLDLVYKQTSTGTSAYFPTIYVFDKNLNYLYKLEYENPVISDGVECSDIYIDNNSMYTVGGYGINSYSSQGGDFILRYDIEITEEKEYIIKTEIIAGEGEIKPSKDSSKSGEEITFTVTPKDGYKLKEVKVFTESNMEITFTEYKFTIPSENVVIKAEFIKESSITNVVNPNTIGGISIIIVSILLLSGIASLVLYNKVRVI